MGLTVSAFQTSATLLNLILDTFSSSGHVNQYSRSSAVVALRSAKMNLCFLSHTGHVFSSVAAMSLNCTAKYRLTVAKAATEIKIVYPGRRRNPLAAFCRT